MKDKNPWTEHIKHFQDKKINRNILIIINNDKNIVYNIHPSIHLSI